MTDDRQDRMRMAKMMVKRMVISVPNSSTWRILMRQMATHSRMRGPRGSSICNFQPAEGMLGTRAASQIGRMRGKVKAGSPTSYQEVITRCKSKR